MNDELTPAEIARALEAHKEEIAEYRNEVSSMRSAVAVMTAAVDGMKASIEKLVTRHEFDPIRLIVYGLVGSLLAGVVGAILSKVFMR